MFGLVSQPSKWLERYPCGVEISGKFLHTVSHKRSQLIFVCNFVKNQRILMHFSLLDLPMNDTWDGMNFTHLT